MSLSDEIDRENGDLDWNEYGPNACDFGQHNYVNRRCSCGAWESRSDGGLCVCGHFGGCHEPRVKCHGLRLTGPGGEHDGGDYAPCRCLTFEARL